MSDRPKTTQKQAVLDYLKEGKTLTTRQAQIDLYISDLGKIISVLRREGHNITSISRTSTNMYGKVNYSVYKLEEEKQDELI